MSYTVITSIQSATPSLVAMVCVGLKHDMETIVVGDRKTPDTTWLAGVDYLSITAQGKMELGLAEKLPENHYSRKNLGYLHAMAQAAEVIFDTDDDNAPLSSWRRRELHATVRTCSQQGWVNAYSWFSDENIWPRGLPLEAILASDTPPLLADSETVAAPVQQGLANGSPDVDAVWRLTQDRDIEFQNNGSVLLKKGVWCPFNSQSTWWFPEAYPLMYLPSFVSFRMTDIWRSFVAQRCLWEMGYGLVFHGPEMVQERNPHNLLRDFEQEIPGYLGNEKIRQVLEAVNLSGSPGGLDGDLYRCYEALVAAGFVPEAEMRLVEAWLHDVATVVSNINPSEPSL